MRKAYLILFDLILIFLSILGSYYIYVYFEVGLGQRFVIGQLLLYGILISAGAVVLLESMGLYNISGSYLYVKEIKIIIRGLLFCFLLLNLIFVLRAITIPAISRFFMSFALGLSILLLTLSRLVYLFLSSRTFKGHINVMVIGYSEQSRKFMNSILRHRVYGYNLAGIADNDLKGDIKGSDGLNPNITIKYLGKISNISMKGIDKCFVFPCVSSEDRLIIDRMSVKYRTGIYWLPDNYINLFYNVEFLYINNIPFLKKVDHKVAFFYDSIKRILDLTISIVLLILLLPFFALMFLIIRWTSHGSAIFKQRRVGKDKKPFYIYKFRTMKKDARPYRISPMSPIDPRITKVGRFLRKFSLDELPQLINVIKGEMSLVGPRPEMPFIVNRYNELENLRLSVKPGLTGIWQISSERAKPIHQSIEYDIFYIYNRSLSMDLAILIETIIFLLNPRGV